MGISGLLPALKSIQQTKSLSDFEGKTVAVDTYAWLHRAVHTCAIELATDKPTTKYVHLIPASFYSQQQPDMSTISWRESEYCGTMALNHTWFSTVARCLPRKRRRYPERRRERKHWRKAEHSTLKESKPRRAKLLSNVSMSPRKWHFSV